MTSHSNPCHHATPFLPPILDRLLSSRRGDPGASVDAQRPARRSPDDRATESVRLGHTDLAVREEVVHRLLQVALTHPHPRRCRRRSEWRACPAEEGLRKNERLFGRAYRGETCPRVSPPFWNPDMSVTRAPSDLWGDH